jgi:hypothetical protein
MILQQTILLPNNVFKRKISSQWSEKRNILESLGQQFSTTVYGALSSMPQG